MPCCCIKRTFRRQPWRQPHWTEADADVLYRRHVRFAAAPRPVSCHHPVLEVRDARRLDRPNCFSSTSASPRLSKRGAPSPSSTGTTWSSRSVVSWRDGRSDRAHALLPADVSRVLGARRYSL